MTQQFFYLSIAGLALSVAGFAGLVTAFRRTEAWTETDLWRLRKIVSLSIGLVLTALLPAPIFALTADETLTVRAIGVVLIGTTLYDVADATRSRDAWSGGSWIRTFIALHALAISLFIAIVVTGLPWLLMLALIIRLEHPMHLFLNVISSFRPPTTTE